MINYSKIGRTVIGSTPIKAKGQNSVAEKATQEIVNAAEKVKTEIAQKAKGNYGIANFRIQSGGHKVAEKSATEVIASTVDSEKLVKTLSNGNKIEMITTKDGRIITKVTRPDGSSFVREKTFKTSKIEDDRLLRRHINGIKDDYFDFVKVERKDTIELPNGNKMPGRNEGKIYGRKSVDLETSEFPLTKIASFERLPEHYRLKLKEPIQEGMGGQSIKNSEVIKEWEASPYAYDLFIPIKKLPVPNGRGFYNGALHIDNGAQVISRGSLKALPFELSHTTNNPQAILMDLIKG